jgi:signal transduction histidine kinase
LGISQCVRNDSRWCGRRFAQDARVLAEDGGRRFSYSHEGEGCISFDDQRIRRVLLNLLVNALSVSPPGGQITLRSQVRDRGGALFEANSLANYLKQVDDVQRAANGILDTISSAVGNDLASGIKAVGAFAAGAAVGEAVMIGITGIAVFYG